MKVGRLGNYDAWVTCWVCLNVDYKVIKLKEEADLWMFIFIDTVHEKHNGVTQLLLQFVSEPNWILWVT